MKILFAFENPLPSPAADAEVFVTTAKHLAALTTESWFHLPATDGANCAKLSNEIGMPVIRAFAPVRPAIFRHMFCGLTLVFRRQFRQADLVYTRNLWVAWLSLLFRQRVVFDHYRPWPEQIPPLQRWIHRLMAHPRFLIHICHSDYTLDVYRRLGVPADKLCCIRNGFDPGRLPDRIPLGEAKRQVGIDPQATTVIYTGRVNHKKGLDLAIAAAVKLPQVQFVLVGSRGEGPIEALAAKVPNVRFVGWQAPEALAPYLFAADMLLIPPSSKPLTQFGSTVLPLKVYLYMASGRPIIAGNTADVSEVLAHERNAWLCQPDSVEALVAGIDRLQADPRYAAGLATVSQADSQHYTWQARAERITNVVSERLNAAPVVAEHWGRIQFQTWRRQSWRWLRHLLRRRSWVMPPATEPADRHS